MTLQFNIVLPGGQQYLPLQVPADWTVADLIAYVQKQGFVRTASWRLQLRDQTLDPGLYMQQLAAYNGATLYLVGSAMPRPTFEGRGKESVLRHTLARGQAKPAPQESASSNHSPLVDWLLRLLS